MASLTTAALKAYRVEVLFAGIGGGSAGALLVRGRRERRPQIILQVELHPQLLACATKLIPSPHWNDVATIPPRMYPILSDLMLVSIECPGVSAGGLGTAWEPGTPSGDSLEAFRIHLRMRFENGCMPNAICVESVPGIRHRWHGAAPPIVTIINLLLSHGYSCAVAERDLLPITGMRRRRVFVYGVRNGNPEAVFGRGCVFSVDPSGPPSDSLIINLHRSCSDGELYTLTRGSKLVIQAARLSAAGRTLQRRYLLKPCHKAWLLGFREEATLPARFFRLGAAEVSLALGNVIAPPVGKELMQDLCNPVVNHQMPRLGQWDPRSTFPRFALIKGAAYRWDATAFAPRRMLVQKRNLWAELNVAFAGTLDKPEPFTEAGKPDLWNAVEESIAAHGYDDDDPSDPEPVRVQADEVLWCPYCGHLENGYSTRAGHKALNHHVYERRKVEQYQGLHGASSDNTIIKPASGRGVKTRKVLDDLIAATSRAHRIVCLLADEAHPQQTISAPSANHQRTPSAPPPSAHPPPMGGADSETEDDADAQDADAQNALAIEAIAKVVSLAKRLKTEASVTHAILQ